MANIEHRDLGNNATKMHGLVWQTVANAAALAALAITADDVAQRKVVLQTDTGQLWVPTAVTPTFQLVTAFSTGIQESSGPTNLSIGALANPSILTRVGTSIVAAAFSVGLSLVAGTLTLAEVSNAGRGALPAISVANAVPVSNGGGTAAVWTALSGGGSAAVGTSRTISTTAPLSGGGDLSANRTLTVATVSNASSGVVPQTNGTAGQALIATAGATTWATNFQAEDLTTSGKYVSTNTTFALSIIGPGAAVSGTGVIRWGHGVNISGRNNANSANRTIIDWGVTANDNLHIGDGSVTMVQNATSSGIGWIIRLNGTQRLSLSTGNLTADVATIGWGSTVSGPMVQQVTTSVNSATGQTLGISGQTATGTTSTGGGVDIYAATGTSANGIVRIRKAGAGTVLQTWNDTGVGLYATAPVAQAARVGQLTDSTTGAASNTINDGGAAYSQVTTNNNNASFLAKINGIETAIHNIGLTA